ncbi:MAG: leucine-rich repeat protein [Clostridia bacterium]|nr:leucine-rich repeat protein [Clostridia bacterium]
MNKNLFNSFVVFCLLLTGFAFVACSPSREVYTISFSVNNQIVETIETSGNEQLDFPTPEFDGFEFKGWYADEEFSNQITENYYINRALTQDIMLYGKLTEINVETKCTIGFSVNGQVIDTLETSGNEQLEFPIPEVDGFEFKGWYSDEKFANQITQDYYLNTTLIQDITLYAKLINASYTSGLSFELQTDDTYAIKKYEGTSTEIVIPETYLNKKVTKVLADSFKNNKSITRVNIGNNVLVIEDYAFYYCSNLAEIKLSNNLSSIGTYAFKWTGLASLILPRTLQTIGVKAFEGCNDLLSVTFANNSTLKSIDNYAFHGCQYLDSITIPNSVEKIGEYAFDSCKRLTSITFEENCLLESIENNVFQYCSNLSAITIPSKVKSIGDYSFGYCSLLETIVLPDSITNIEMAFYSCKTLTTINLPKNLETIKAYAFQYCSKLSTITIPASVTSIGINPFSGCTSLTSIVVETGNTIYDSRNNCNAIIKKSNNTLIAGCKNTTIQNSVTSIGRYAFQACGLTSLSIPESVQNIGDSAFIGCATLTEIIISKSVTNISQYAFSGCSNLSSVYYLGTEEEWSSITKGSNYLWQSTPTIYYYSETVPNGTGNYWHYVNNVPIIY